MLFVMFFLAQNKKKLLTLFACVFSFFFSMVSHNPDMMITIRMIRTQNNIVTMSKLPIWKTIPRKEDIEENILMVLSMITFYFGNHKKFVSEQKQIEY